MTIYIIRYNIIRFIDTRFIIRLRISWPKASPFAVIKYEQHPRIAYFTRPFIKIIFNEQMVKINVFSKLAVDNLSTVDEWMEI